MLNQQICGHTWYRRLLDIRPISLHRYQHFIFPSTTGWRHLTPWHKASSHTLSFSRSHIFRRTGVGVSRWKKRTGGVGVDNEKKRVGVKIPHCSPHPDTAGLQPCSTLIHHYRFTITFLSPLPPTLQHAVTVMLWVWAMCASVDLEPNDQVNLWSSLMKHVGVLL